MALFVNSCILVLLIIAQILLLEAYYNVGIGISNGTNYTNLVPLDKYSFIVLVNLTIKQTYCTGALISRSFVLTVAHCVSEENDTSIRIYREMLEGSCTQHDQNDTRNNAEPVIGNCYEERGSVEITRPWLYRTSKNKFDIALVEVDKMFELHNFHKMNLQTPFIPPDVPVKCKAVGYDVDAIRNKRSMSTLIEETLLVKKQFTTNHKSDDMLWIVQEDNKYIAKTFADSAALLFCSHNLTRKTPFNGIATGKLHDFPSETKNLTNYRLVFTDICPYLSWIRAQVGPSIMRSPGHHGKDCFSGSSLRPHTKSRIAWFVVIVCILLYF